jgi:pre-rRNA-processing protein IPI3
MKDRFIVTANNVKPLLNFWPINSSEPIQNVKFVLPGRANSFATSPNGCFLVAGIKENIYIWQIATGKMLNMLAKHYQPINKIKFLDDNSHFVTAGQDGQVIVWNLADCVDDQIRTEPISPTYSFSDHSLPVTDLWIGKGGLRAMMCTVSLDRTCKLYDLSGGSMLLSLVFQEMLTAVVVDRVEIGLFVGTNQGNIFQYNLQPPPRVKEYHITDQDRINNKFAGHSKAISCLSISVDEKTLLSGSEDENVITWNIQSRSMLKTFHHKGAITNAMFILKPQIMFDREAKLELVTKNFQRMVDQNENQDDETIEILVTDNLYDMAYGREEVSGNLTYSNPCTSSSSSDEVQKLRDEIAKLKKINSELYEFSLQHLMKKQ